MAVCAMTDGKVESAQFLWSIESLCSQSHTNTKDLELIFSQDTGQPSHRHLRNKWFSNVESTSTLELSTTGLLAFSVIAASQGNPQLRDSLQVALTIVSIKDHERYFQRIPTLSSYRTMFRAYVDVCLKFVHVCDAKTGTLDSDSEIVMVWSSMIEPLGEMLNLIFRDHLHRTNSQWFINIPKPQNFEAITELLQKSQNDVVFEQFHSYDFEGDQRFQSGVQQILLKLAVNKKGGNQDLLLQAKLFYFSRFYFEIELEGYEAWLNVKFKEKETTVVKKDNNPNADETCCESTQTNQDSGEIVSEDIEGNTSEHKDILHTEQSEAGLLTDEEKARKIEDNTDSLHTSSTESIREEDNAEASVVTQHSANASGSTESHDFGMSVAGSLDTNINLNPKENDVATESTNSSSIYPTSFMQMLQLVQEGKEIPGVEHLHIEPTNNPPTESSMERSAKPWQA